MSRERPRENGDYQAGVEVVQERPLAPDVVALVPVLESVPPTATLLGMVRSNQRFAGKNDGRSVDRSRLVGNQGGEPALDVLGSTEEVEIGQKLQTAQFQPLADLELAYARVKAIPVKQIPRDRSTLPPEVLACLRSGGLEEEIAETCGSDSASELKASPTWMKRGQLEEVVPLTCGDRTLALLLPNPGKFGAFRKSQAALSLGAGRLEPLGLPCLIPPLLQRSIEGRPVAVMPFAPFVEMNFFHDYMAQPDSQYVCPVPRLRVLSGGRHGVIANRALETMPDPEKRLLLSYFGGKVIRDRTLMVLSTLLEYGEGVVGWAPKNPKVAAGDFLGRFDPQGRLDTRVCTFRGGVKPVGSFGEIVADILGTRDFVIDAEGNESEVSLVPTFDPRDRSRWVEGIAAGVAKDLLERTETRGSSGFNGLLKTFLAQDGAGRSVEKTAAVHPFSLEHLEAVSRHFGREWLGW